MTAKEYKMETYDVWRHEGKPLSSWVLTYTSNSLDDAAHYYDELFLSNVRGGVMLLSSRGRLIRSIWNG